MGTVNTLEIKRLRKLKKLKQQDVAGHLNLKFSTYANKEKKGDFDENEILLLAKFFEVDKRVIQISGSAHGTSHVSGELTNHVNSSELLVQIDSLMSMQRAQMELLLYLVETSKEGRNVSAEILKKYGIAGMFADRHKLSKA